MLELRPKEIVDKLNAWNVKEGEEVPERETQRERKQKTRKNTACIPDILPRNEQKKNEDEENEE